MSSNKLELGQFINWNCGQNYPFGACMAKLIECLGGDSALYTYDFFAGIAGDDFVMCYGDNERFNDCVSVCVDNEAFIARVLGMIGLKYRLVKHSEWTGELQQYYTLVKQFIDRGIPILCAGVAENSNYDLLISYDDETGKCHLSCGDDIQYGIDIPFDDIECDFVFIEHLPEITDIALVYQNAVKQIPDLMTAKKTADGVVFGPDAYRNWAEDIISGRYNRYTSEDYDSWRHWCIYICNLATNAGHGEGFLRRAYDLNSNLTFVPNVISLLYENNKIWSELELLGGGFNCTLEVLHDKAKAMSIAKTILKLVVTNEKIINIISAYTNGCA